MEKVIIYDTTLRDGAQRGDINLSLDDKLKITSALDKLGVNYIEGGWPGANKKDTEYFKKVKSLFLKNSKIVAFGSTRKKNNPVGEDPNLKALVEADTSSICIFGKTSVLHVRDVLKVSLEENLKMIFDSISFLKSKDKEVIYDAEHFFDGYKENHEYAIETLKKAQEAGASWIVLCDTNGGIMPDEIANIVSKVKQKVSLPLGIHTHNDSECAVANSIMAVINGCTMVQGTVNGYGERCGNANLISVIPNLQFHYGYDLIPAEKMELLRETSLLVSDILNISPYDYQPFIGDNAFTHKAGIHIDAVLKSSKSYEHISPELVGNSRKLIISEQSGLKTIYNKAKELGIIIDDKEKAQEILLEIKKLESKGYHFENAEGSFYLLIRRILGSYKPFFNLLSYHVHTDKQSSNGQKIHTDAILKIEIPDKKDKISKTGEGDGPVHALDTVLRKALFTTYPDLKKIKLIDYKVRVLNFTGGTAAKVRVWIESNNGHKSWGTIGVDDNIIEASWKALADSIEYGLTITK